MTDSRMPGLFLYDGPAGLLQRVCAAFAWVAEPHSGSDIARAGCVRQVRVRGDALHVVLRLPPGPLLPGVVQDVEAELFDHLQGAFRIVVDVLPPRQAPVRARRGCGTG